jgi:polysaccharide pyruvyl transferase WcaK-like protein
MLLGLRDAFAKQQIPCELKVFSFYPDRDAKIAGQFPDVSVHPGHPKHIAFALVPWIIISKISMSLVPKKWRQHIQALKDCDAVLAVGGTTFADSMQFKVPWNVLAALPGYMLGKRTIFLSQTMGPTRSWFNRLCARWTLKRAVAVHGRGRESTDWVQKLKIPNCEYKPDLSFPMVVPAYDEVCKHYPIAEELNKKITATGPLVGVAPNSIVYDKCNKQGKSYIDFLVQTIITLAKKNYFPVLIPHSYREDVSKLHNNDRALCNEVMKRLPADVDCFYLDADLPSPELRSIIGQLHVLVASRFHSMVSALSMNVPPLTYGWGDHKYLEVLVEFGMQDYYVPYHEIDSSTFEGRFDKLITNRDELVAGIRKSRAVVCGAADRIPQDIMSALGMEQTAAPPSV